MVRIITLALGIQLFNFAAYAERKNKTIIIDAEDGAGPWGQANGTGAGNDLVLAAYKAANTDVQLRVVPYTRCKMEVFKGKVDGCFGMGVDSETKTNTILAEKPLYTPANTFIMAKGTSFGKTIKDIPPGTTVGIVNGYEYHDEVMNLQAQGIKIEKIKR